MQRIPLEQLIKEMTPAGVTRYSMKKIQGNQFHVSFGCGEERLKDIILLFLDL